MGTIVKALMTLSVVVLAVGCGSPPTARADAAKGRVAALAAEAEIHAPAAYAEAQRVVAQLNAEMAEQAGGFAPFRSYDTTNELIAAVEAAAEKLATTIEAEKRLSGDNDRLAVETQRAIAELRGSLDERVSARRPSDQASSWQSDLDAAEASFKEGERLRASGQHAEAQAAFTRASEAVSRARTSMAAHEVEVKEREAAAAPAARGEVTLSRSVLADGTRLSTGSYRLELRDQGPSSDGIRPGRWIEFVRNGKVAGRALAVVVPDAEIGQVAAVPGPRNGIRIAELQGGEYIRVWLHRQGVNYLIHLPVR